MSYHKSSQQTEERNNTAHSAAASAAMAAAQWSHQGQKANDEQFVNIQAPYSEEDIERLAEYSVCKFKIFLDNAPRFHSQKKFKFTLINHSWFRLQRMQRMK